MYVEFPTFEQAVVFHQRDNDGCNPAPTALSFMPLDEDRRFEPPEMHELISSAVDVICPNGFQQPSASSPMMMTTAAVGGAEHHQHANGPLPSVGQGVGGAAPGEALANASGSVNEAEGPYSPVCFINNLILVHCWNYFIILLHWLPNLCNLRQKPFRIGSPVIFI
jgi:hypothetical protein